MATIDVVISVNTAALLRDHPHGWWPNGTALDNYYQVLVRRANSFEDPSDKSHTGIVCDVQDVLFFRAVTRGPSGDGVIIAQFADTYDGASNATASQTTILEHLSPPRTDMVWNDRSLGYSLSGNPQQQYPWNGFQRWLLPVTSKAKADPLMSLVARKSTGDLPNDHLRYTLGFDVVRDGATTQYRFDPCIRIR